MPWYQTPPDQISLEDAAQILNDPDSHKLFPNQTTSLIQSLQQRILQIKEQSQQQNPLAWFQPSYEQTLKLNAWIMGIDYIIDFDANRIGKTAGGVVNALLWIIPNDPEWVMFQPFTDHLNRTYRTIPRPSIHTLKALRAHHAAHSPPLTGDPRAPLDAPQNIPIVEATLSFIHQHTPLPPHSIPRIRTIWVGGPDHKWNEENIIAEWKKWTPPIFITKPYAAHHNTLEITTPHPSPTKTTPSIKTTIIFKSYDSEDTKWSGGAVDGIQLSEGVPQSIFNEVKQRFKYPAFGSWDYTPYEPRNTAGKSALAHKVFTGEEPLPLHPYIYSGFGIKDTPTYIMDDDKRNDLIRNWEGRPEGDARIKGIFYTSSPIVLKNYSPSIHALPLDITLETLRKKYAPYPLILFRGIDPGWGHVTAAAWMALAPDNTKFIYQIYSESQRSIEERCTDIINLSGNKRVPNPNTSLPGYFKEEVTNPATTAIRLTWIDYHTFKTDENTKRPFALNYNNNGLIVRPSITFGPKERGQMLNDLLMPQAHLPHPATNRPPGSKIYFLMSGSGVSAAVHKISNIFYQTYEKGEKRGLTKDAIQDYDDDELDAICYVTCPTIVYHSFINPSQSSSSFSSVDRDREPTPSFGNIQFIN